MCRFLIAVLSTTVFTPTVSASDLIVEGDGLELIAEYKITDDGYETVYRDEELASAINLDSDSTPFILEGKTHGPDRSPDVLVYFDENLGVKHTVTGDPGEHCKLHPIGYNGAYVKETSYYHSGEDAGFRFKEVYGVDGSLVSTIASRGWVAPYRTTEKFIIANLGYYNDKCYGLKVYNGQGDLLGYIDDDYPLGMTIGPFDRDNDWFIAADRLNINKDAIMEKGVERGTKVFNEYGELEFTLNPNTVCWPGVANVRGNVFYGSGNYICQVGISAYIVKEEFTKEQISHMEQDRIALESYRFLDRNETILEVYDGSGNELWSYLLPGPELEWYLAVSDNERYLSLVMGNNNQSLVFDMLTGKAVYEINDMFEVNRAIYFGDVSNDGSVAIIVSEFFDNNRKGIFELSVYQEGIETSSITSNYDDSGPISSFITPDGEYLVAGVPSTVCVYKIK